MILITSPRIDWWHFCLDRKTNLAQELIPLILLCNRELVDYKEPCTLQPRRAEATSSRRQEDKYHTCELEAQPTPIHPGHIVKNSTMERGRYRQLDGGLQLDVASNPRQPTAFTM